MAAITTTAWATRPTRTATAIPRTVPITGPASITRATAVITRPGPRVTGPDPAAAAAAAVAVVVAVPADRAAGSPLVAARDAVVSGVVAVAAESPAAAASVVRAVPWPAVPVAAARVAAGLRAGAEPRLRLPQASRVLSLTEGSLRAHRLRTTMRRQSRPSVRRGLR